MKEYFGKQTFQYLVTVCDNADEKCPTSWPGVMHRYHWAFEDPAATKGTREEQLDKFRRVRDQIKDRLEAWLKNPGIGIHSSPKRA